MKVKYQRDSINTWDLTWVHGRIRVRNSLDSCATIFGVDRDPDFGTFPTHRYRAGRRREVSQQTR